MLNRKILSCVLDGKNTRYPNWSKHLFHLHRMSYFFIIILKFLLNFFKKKQTKKKQTNTSRKIFYRIRSPIKFYLIGIFLWLRGKQNERPNWHGSVNVPVNNWVSMNQTFISFSITPSPLPPESGGALSKNRISLCRMITFLPEQH